MIKEHCTGVKDMLVEGKGLKKQRGNIWMVRGGCFSAMVGRSRRDRGVRTVGRYIVMY